MMYIMHNNDNYNNNDNECQKLSFRKRHLCGISINIFKKNKLIFIKKAVLHTTTLLQCKARQVSHDLFSTNQGNGSKMTFVAGNNTVHMKNLKT